jgi:uncharacterized protein
MTSSVTHFEIYAEEPANLVDFYRHLLGWELDKVPGIDYWRIRTGLGQSSGISGGLTYRPLPGPRSWVHYVHVNALDATVAEVLRLGGEVLRHRLAYFSTMSPVGPCRQMQAM